jgi:hypothetical protein
VTELSIPTSSVLEARGEDDSIGSPVEASIEADAPSGALDSSL